ncbi:hypothetical protein AU378_12725 [Chryseobacterium kwangjuense]|uniref:Uncharacterized protein n=1 Tax=Chryseobacterium kwangjuense TaxID=267125 RepID=A0A135WEE5_9FLAO|nr:hypothetical protein AU378_12725 [Chryseobacterium kwangjuense]
MILKKNIVILLDFHCLFKEGGWDHDILRQLIAVLHIFKQDNITIVDRDNKVYRTILPKIEHIQADHIVQKNHFDQALLHDYDLIIAHYKLEAEFISLTNSETFNSFYFFNNKSNPNLVFPGISLYIKENKISFDLKTINEQVHHLTKKLEPVVHTDATDIVLEKEKISKICLICDFNQKFFIGDSCFWYYDLNQKLYILNRMNALPKNIDIYITSVRNYLEIKRIFSASLPENIKLYNSSLKNINLESYDLVIVEYLLYSDVKALTAPEKNNVLTYTFPLAHDKLKNIQNVSFAKHFPFPDMKSQLQYNKKYYNNIEIRDEEIEWANQWLETHGAEKKDEVFALTNAASQSEKIIDSEAFINIIRWLIEERKYKILLFGQDLSVQEHLKNSLDTHLYHSIIFPGKLELRKEMALMASDYVHGLLSPCTGLAHLFNGINYYLHHIAGKNRKKCIVYTGKQTYTNDYHPLKWWNFKYVDCLSYVLAENQYVLAEKKDLLNIRNFDDISVPTREIPYGMLRDKIDEIILS